MGRPRRCASTLKMTASSATLATTIGASSRSWLVVTRSSGSCASLSHHIGSIGAFATASRTASRRSARTVGSKKGNAHSRDSTIARSRDC